MHQRAEESQQHKATVVSKKRKILAFKSIHKNNRGAKIGKRRLKNTTKNLDNDLVTTRPRLSKLNAINSLTHNNSTSTNDDLNEQNKSKIRNKIINYFDDTSNASSSSSSKAVAVSVNTTNDDILGILSNQILF